MNKRGQFISVDLAASILVFSLLLFFLYQSWISNFSRWNELKQADDLENRAVQTAENLAESPGFPMDWNAMDVNVVGLALTSGVLNKKKLDYFSVMDYNLARQKMNISNFDFRLEIAALSGPNPSIDRNIGVLPGLQTSVAAVERKVLIGDQYALFRFKLFR